MSASAIASGAVILSANADGLASGLSKASNDIQHWGVSNSAGLKSSLSGGGAGGGIGGMLGGLGGGMGSLLMKIPGPAMVAGAALAGLGVAAHTVFGTLNDLAATNKAAGVLGVSASAYAGMQKVLERVGVEGSDVTTMFAKMGKNILTSSAAGEQFAKMGIDPKALAGQDLTEQFKTIAEGFTKIPRGAEQATAALEIFGKSGATLLPILQKGKEGINDLIKGESFEILSDKQYAAAGKSVAAWKAAKKDINGAWDGIVNHASVAFAPIVGFIGTTVSKIMKRLEPVFEWWGRAWGQIGEIAEMVFDVIGEAFDVAAEWFDSAIASLGEFTGGWMSIEDVIVGVFRAMGTAGGYAFDVLAKGTGYIVQGIVKLSEAFDFVTNALAKLVHSMKDIPGMPKWFKNYEAGLDAQITKAREVRKVIGEWGEKQANRRFGQGADDFNAWLDKALAPKPKKPGDPGPADPGLESRPADVWNPGKFAGAIMRGSKEAYSIEMQAKYGEFGKPDNVHKDNGKKIDGTNNKLDEVIKRLGKIEDTAAAMEGA